MLHTTVLVHMGYNGPLREVSTNATNIQSLWSWLDKRWVLYLLATMGDSILYRSISSTRGRTIWTDVKRNDGMKVLVYNIT